MAGSRLEKFGSVFTRMRGLLRSGAVQDTDKPLWYEVYEAFPPKQVPEHDRAVPEEPVKNILYAEDMIRVEYYKVFGNPDVVDLKNEAVKTTCQKFVEKYIELMKTETDQHGVFRKTTEAIRIQGIRLRTLEEVQKDQQLLKDKSTEKSPLVEKWSAKDVFGRVAEVDEDDLGDYLEDDQHDPR